MGTGNARRYRITTNADRRQAAKKGDPVLGKKQMRIRKWQRRTLIRKHRGICAICGEPVVLSPEGHPRFATIDHIVPLALGGEDALSNMQLACLECNHAKGMRLLQEHFSGNDPDRP